MSARIEIYNVRSYLSQKVQAELLSRIPIMSAMERGPIVLGALADKSYAPWGQRVPGTWQARDDHLKRRAYIIVFLICFIIDETQGPGSRMQPQLFPGSLTSSCKTIIALLLSFHIAACATLPTTSSSKLLQTGNECTSDKDWLGLSAPSVVSALGRLLLLLDNDWSLRAHLMV